MIKPSEIFSFPPKMPFSMEKTICRLFASWLSFAAVKAFGEGRFTELAFARETSVLEMLLWIAAFFALYSLIGAFMGGIHTDSWLMFASATVCVVRWLFLYGSPTVSFGLIYEKDISRFMFLIAVILAYSLVIVYFIFRNTQLLERIKTGRKTAVIIGALLAAAGCTVIAVITSLRYMTFTAGNYDFGLFCQSFHYMKETGIPFVTSERDVLMSHFLVHFSPVMYLLLPFYAVFESPLTLQIGQALICFSGIIPLMLLCRHLKIGNKTMLLMCFVYSAYPALSCGCLYDFHENCFLVPLLLWMFFFYEKEKWIPFYVFALLVMAVKEDAAVYVVIFAIYIILSKRKYLHGVLLGAAGIAYFVIVTTVMNNSASAVSEYYLALGESANPAVKGVMINRFDNLIFDTDSGLLDALKTIVVNPGYVLTQLFSTSSGGIGKIVYALEMLLCLGFIPFITKKASRWLLLAPMLLNLLTMYQYQYNIGFQYSFGIMAFLFYGTILNLSEMSVNLRRNMLSAGAAACLCLYIVTVIPYLNTNSERWTKNREKYMHMTEILETIPEDASLNVSSPLVAHLSRHEELYEIAYHQDEDDVDYVVYYYPHLDEKSMNRYLGAGYTVWKDIPGELLILEKGTEETDDLP